MKTNNTLSASLLGPINVDVTMPIEKYPEEGDDAGSPTCSVETGGVVGNTAIVLAKLGVNTNLLGCVGDDVWGSLALNAFKNNGVNVSGISITPETSTGLNFAAVSKGGERTFFNAWGANIWTEPSSFNLDIIKSTSILQITGHPLTRSANKSIVLKAIDIAQSNNIPICMDTSIRPVFDNPEEIRSVIPKLKICILGYKEACYLVNEDEPFTIAEHILSQGPEMVAIKLSEKGSVLVTKTKRSIVPPYQVDTVDTTGAGDTFTAGIIVGWLSKLDLYSTGVLANMLGALATTVYGAGTKLPGANEITSFIASLDPKDKHKIAIDQILELFS